MARVTGRDREITKRRTGDSSFPMETAAQIRSAIKLRHHGKKKSAAEVLRLAAAAARRLRRQGKISQRTYEALMRLIEAARERDRRRSE